jgi:glycosyltransferase involved in cell wall biosynthesis
MNILFLDQFSDLGGAQKCLLDLTPALQQRGWRVHIAAAGEGALRERATALGASYRRIRSGPYESGGKSLRDVVHFAAELPALTREIGKLAAECDADLLYVNGPRLLPAAALAARDRLPLVFHCHNYLGQGYAAALAGLAAAKATVIACCRFVGSPILPYLAPRQFHVAYNGVDCVGRAPCPTVAQSHTGRTHIGLLGRIAPEKGQLEFLEAARLLPRDCRFTICGAPLFSNPAAIEYFEQVKRRAAGLPVEFTGWREDIHTVLSTLDLLVVPSAAGEATPRVIMEAYAAGVPVVASNSGGIPEILTDGETGFLAPTGDPVRLAMKIREALDQPALRKQVAENARRAWSERFTVPHYQARVLSILDKIGASARA